MPDPPRSRDGSDDASDDEDWRFELSSLDDDAAEDAASAERPPLEPGSPSAENVFFVLVGVALTLLLILSAFVPLPLVA